MGKVYILVLVPNFHHFLKYLTTPLTQADFCQKRTQAEYFGGLGQNNYKYKYNKIWKVRLSPPVFQKLLADSGGIFRWFQADSVESPADSSVIFKFNYSKIPPGSASCGLGPNYYKEIPNSPPDFQKEWVDEAGHADGRMRMSFTLPSQIFPPESARIRRTTCCSAWDWERVRGEFFWGGFCLRPAGSTRIQTNSGGTKIRSNLLTKKCHHDNYKTLLEFGLTNERVHIEPWW